MTLADTRATPEGRRSTLINNRTNKTRRTSDLTSAVARTASPLARAGAAVGASVVMVLAAGCGGDAEKAASQAASSASSVATQASSQAGQSATSASSAASSAVSQANKPFTMPNEVGQNLQVAQDHLQEVSGNPLYVSKSQDATGMARQQVRDKHWKICSQTPAAGSEVKPDAMVVFQVVKLDETCP